MYITNIFMCPAKYKLKYSKEPVKSAVIGNQLVYETSV